ncbi:hypothetical protein RR42_m2981 [Cupriavidus basilensis]|uniref:Uncharacterized protein n=1 Tax=Cupriavidus basilensis TaxID=68895 RepID=A0A0C4YBQ1_9BURK|nr:hypothetical protein RR42_m2981 [Cupriavidus basilensis]
MLDRLQALQDPDGGFAVLTDFARHGVACLVGFSASLGGGAVAARQPGGPGSLHCNGSG